MSKTFQKTSKEKPKPECKNLAIMIACVNCPAVRIFKIDSAVESLRNRETAGFIIETKCEECGHLISATIAWIDATKPGYSYRKLPFSATKQVVTVADDNGLKR